MWRAVRAPVGRHARRLKGPRLQLELRASKSDGAIIRRRGQRNQLSLFRSPRRIRQLERNTRGFQLATRRIASEPTFVIAEAVNHNGDIDVARKLAMRPRRPAPTP